TKTVLVGRMAQNGCIRGNGGAKGAWRGGGKTNKPGRTSAGGLAKGCIAGGIWPPKKAVENSGEGGSPKDRPNRSQYRNSRRNRNRSETGTARHQAKQDRRCPVGRKKYRRRPEPDCPPAPPF